MHPWNEPVLDSMRRSLERLPHALLIHGPRGVGKLELAERLAGLLLCEHADAARRPCGACDGCRWYLVGNHPDLRRVEPEALAKVAEEAGEEEGSEPAPSGRRAKQPSLDIKVEQVRALADFLNVGSHRGRLRIALVHPAEEMNPITQNALLKSLEEPPAGAMFILVSHRPFRLLPTIRSRCVSLPVALPSREAALAWLSTQSVPNAERWLDFAGGAPLRAVQYAAEGQAWERLLRAPEPVDDRESLERLADVLQKVAYDRAFAAFGLAPKYRTGPAKAGNARRWLAYARKMGENRMLTRHPLNPRLFSAEMLAELQQLL